MIILVSTILCPRCKTKNAKTAEICYKCKSPLKTRKKPSILSTNPNSKLEFKIIAMGILIFIMTNVILFYIAYEYSFMFSGFSTLVYLYFAFKNSPTPQSNNKFRSTGFKIILNYLIIVILGSLTLWTLGFV